MKIASNENHFFDINMPMWHMVTEIIRQRYGLGLLLLFCNPPMIENHFVFGDYVENLSNQS